MYIVQYIVWSDIGHWTYFGHWTLDIKHWTLDIWYCTLSTLDNGKLDIVHWTLDKLDIVTLWHYDISPPKYWFGLWFVYKIPIWRVFTEITSFPSFFRTSTQHYDRLRDFSKKKTEVIEPYIYNIYLTRISGL